MQLIDPCIIHSINILIQYFISIGKKVDKIKYAKKKKLITISTY